MLESFVSNRGREDLKTRKMKKEIQLITTAVPHGEENKLREMKTKLGLERLEN